MRGRHARRGPAAARPPRAPTPSAVAREVLETLRRRADPKKAEEVQRYFKDRVAAFGIALPELRRIAGSMRRGTGASWSVGEALRFCDILIRDRHLEAKAVGLFVMEGFARDLSPRHLPRIKGWLERSSGNWATVDQIAPRLIGPLIDRHPRLAPLVVSWSRSRSMWVRRASAVAFVPHGRRGRHLDAAYEIASRLLREREDLLHKANGWLLREAGKIDPARLKDFLLRHGPAIPRTSLRYAIERFPASEKRSLMEATRRG